MFFVVDIFNFVWFVFDICDCDDKLGLGMVEMFVDVIDFFYFLFECIE